MTPAFSRSIYSLITPPMVEAICAEAHKLGMTVTGHVPNGMTIDQAATAGMDQIAHLAIRGEAGSDEVKRIIGVLRDRKTVIDPTLSWNELLGHAAGTPMAVFQPPTARSRLESIKNIRTVRWTIKDGKVYDAPALWKSVRFQP